MNIARMEKLAETLETEETLKGMGFKMSTPASVDRVEEVTCGTVGCIAGWACVMYGNPDSIITIGSASDLLGLTLEQEVRLFTPYSGKDLFSHITNGDLYSASAKEAAVAVRKLIAEEINRD